MVRVSGPPYDRYPPMVDGSRETFYNGKRLSNVFDIKRQIFERENKNFRSLAFYRKTSRELLNIFSDGQILGSDNEIQSVNCSYANYERAIAMLFKTRNLTLPIMTLAIADTVEDLERRKPNEYVMGKFRPQLRVGTDFNTNAPAFITSISDNSTLTVPDREDRIIKKTVTFEVETWMPTRQYMIQSNGAIREMNYEVELKTDISFSGNGIPSESILATSGSETLVVPPLPSS